MMLCKSVSGSENSRGGVQQSCKDIQGSKASQRAQHGLRKEHGLNCMGIPNMIEGMFLN